MNLRKLLRENAQYSGLLRVGQLFHMLLSNVKYNHFLNFFSEFENSQMGHSNKRNATRKVEVSYLDPRS